jgi:hypothetical protein
MSKRYAIIILVLFELSVQIANATETTIAYVKTVENDAEIITSNKHVKAQLGSPIQLNDTLKTGENGTMGIIFKDNTVMSLGNNSEITVDEYLYAPSREQLGLVASVSKGTLHYISGVIAKLKPEAVSIKTNLATIGVRGTRFVVKVDED